MKEKESERCKVMKQGEWLKNKLPNCKVRYTNDFGYTIFVKEDKLLGNCYIEMNCYSNSISVYNKTFYKIAKEFATKFKYDELVKDWC